VAVLLPIAIIDGNYLIGFIKSEPVEVIEGAAPLKKSLKAINASSPISRPWDSTLALAAPICLQSTRSRSYISVFVLSAPLETFLFFGQEEARRWPSLRSLQTPKSAPEWLLPVGHGEPVGSSWCYTKLDVRFSDGANLRELFGSGAASFQERPVIGELCY
jgi:hypothetical protein